MSEQQINISDELFDAFGYAVLRVAGRSFVTRKGLEKGIADLVVNPWRFGGPDTLRKVARLALDDVELCERLGIGAVMEPTTLSVLMGRKTTRLLLMGPPQWSSSNDETELLLGVGGIPENPGRAEPIVVRPPHFVEPQLESDA